MNKQSLNGQQHDVRMGVVEVSLFFLIFIRIPHIQLLMTTVQSISIILDFQNVLDRSNRLASNCCFMQLHQSMGSLAHWIIEDGNMEE